MDLFWSTMGTCLMYGYKAGVDFLGVQSIP